MNKKNVLIMVLAMMLVCVMSVAGTLAWLTAETLEVKNTFTVGKVKIALTEAKVDEYGVATEGRWDADEAEEGKNVGNEYKLIPGHNYTKDPTITIEKGSEECYVFVKVVNGISELEDQEGNTIAKQIENNGWTALTGVDNVYYKEQAAATEAAADLIVFNEFTLATDANVEQYSGEDAAELPEITITAYAVQKDGMDSATDAWSNANFN